jgi:hypothetical protein
MGALKAAHEILLAAAELSGEERREFSEWDLTVRVWEMNRGRFGCRGYEEQYPDHKRVMMELMGKAKLLKQNGWVEKARKNHYRIGLLGLAEAARLKGAESSSYKRNVPLYDALERFALHPVFESHLQSTDEPRTWLGAASFLALPRNDPELLSARLAEIEHAIDGSVAWMAEAGTDILRRGDAGRPISRERILRLREFLSTLQERFQPQFDAIRHKQQHG